MKLKGQVTLTVGGACLNSARMRVWSLKKLGGNKKSTAFVGAIGTVTSGLEVCNCFR